MNNYQPVFTDDRKLLIIIEEGGRMSRHRDRYIKGCE
jgi:hypothetical protein